MRELNSWVKFSHNGVMANIGYARVSRRDQDPELQFRDLRAARCEPIFEEKVSGGKGVEERPALKEALRYCREGDVFVVWKLDRLGRSLRDLIDIPQALKERGIGFRSLRENLDEARSLFIKRL